MNEEHVKALVFGATAPPDASHLADGLSAAQRALATTPMELQQLERPDLPGADWVLLRTRLCGICGSDKKQVLMDGDMDNAITSLISFPQVLGHEVVAEVVEAGPDAQISEGQRVILNPWLSCAPRGLDPVCPACEVGDLSLCHHFTDGHLAPGIHTGNSAQAPGGFGELIPAHDSMCVPVPDDVPDEVAVLADPFAVALHSVLHNPPPPQGTVLVYGAGALGLSTCAVLQALYPDVKVAAVARFRKQAELAESQGAHVLAPEPVEDLITGIARWSGGTLRQPYVGRQWLHPGGVDVVYDTIGSPETLEVAIRVTCARGTVAVTGVSAPGRFEWSPWYFKELRIVGSNAFGIEEIDGESKHAIAHYLDLVRAGRVDLSGMLTHTFTLDDWREAFTALADKDASNAVKIAFDYRKG
jgi:threonine dehydrogenase-like Zn-dependent dehydrogenase